MIEQVKVSALVPYGANARLHQVTQVAASIKTFGFTNPVLIDEANGIIAGHGRVQAAQALGLETVPCLRLTHLSEREKRAYIIADNRIADLSSWDEAALRAQVDALLAEGAPLLGLFDESWDPGDKVEEVAEHNNPLLARVVLTCAMEDEPALREFLELELALCPIEEARLA